MAELARPPRTRLIVGLALALLMQGGWVRLLRGVHGGRVSAFWDDARSVQVRLLPLTSPKATPPTPPKSPDRPRAPGIYTPPIPDYFPGPEVVRDAAAEPVGAPPVAATPPTGGAGERRSTLNLALPSRRAASDARPESMAAQATRDPRANSERRGVEWAVRDAAGTLPVTVQSSTSGSGSVLIRQGSKCIRVTENRVAALNPMDQRLKDAPAVAGPCYN